jgi:predicted  nucleic acid-binding Zn-ribbon protein
MSVTVRVLEFALTFLIAASFLPHRTHATAPPLWQQLSSAQPPSAAQRHKSKIWTNDDIVTLRTPADVYILEKEAKVAADEAKALMSCFAPGPADAEVEDTQKEIDAASQSIRDAEAAVTQARRAFDDAPENLKARNRTELERRTLELDAYRDQLKLLQQRLHKLNAQPSAETSAVPPTEPPQ